MLEILHSHLFLSLPLQLVAYVRKEERALVPRPLNPYKNEVIRVYIVIVVDRTWGLFISPTEVDDDLDVELLDKVHHVEELDDNFEARWQFWSSMKI